MAEIRVEEKKGTGAKWLWLLLLLLVILAAVWFFSNTRTPETGATGAEATTPIDSVHFTPSEARTPPPTRAA